MKIQLLEDLLLDYVGWRFLLQAFIINLACNPSKYLIKKLRFPLSLLFFLDFLVD